MSKNKRNQLYLLTMGHLDKQDLFNKIKLLKNKQIK